MKRVRNVFLSLLMLLVMVGCGVTTTTTQASTTTTTTATTTTTTTTQSESTTTQAGTTTTQAGTTTATTTTSPVETTTTTTQTVTTTTTHAVTTAMPTTTQSDPIEGSLLDVTAHLFASAYDWYTIHLEEDGLLKAYTLGMLDTYGAMYDGNLNLLFEDDESGFESNFLFDVFLPAGTYHIVVMGYDDTVYGDYRLVAEFLAEDEAPLLINVSTTLQAAAENRYDFTITQPGVMVAYTMGFVDTFGELWESDDFQVATSDDDGTNANIRFEAYLLPGDYSIRVRGYEPTEVGDYQMIIYFEPDNPADHDQSVAATLPPGGEQSYSVTLEQAGYLSVCTLGDVDTYGKVLDAFEVTVAENDDGGFGGNFQIDVYLQPGTYTVVVTGYDPSESGDYRINIDFVPERFFPHLLEEEGTVVEGGELWYEVTIAQAGYLIAYTESRMDTYGYLYDSNMNLLAEADDTGGYLDFLLLRRVEPGTYKILVMGNDPTTVGDFRFYVDFEAGDASKLPYYFSAFGVMTAGIGGTYQVILTEPGYLMAFTVSSIDTYGTLKDASEAIVAEDDDTYGDYNFFLSEYVSAGTYLIVVEGYDEETFGDYLLIINYFPYVE